MHDLEATVMKVLFGGNRQCLTVLKIMKSEPASNQIPEDGETNDYLKQMWAGQSNILVAVRVRPLMKHDQIKKSCIRVLDGKVVVVLDPAAGDKQDILRANRNREKQYAFDFVFDPSCTQDHIYNNTTKFLIHGVLDGYNATVFAYGQTGSGKVSFIFISR
jgi:kinesin family protein 18/19